VPRDGERRFGNSRAVQKIRQILWPKEYAKVDEIIGLVFSAATKAKAEEKLQLEIESLEKRGKKSTPVKFPKV